MEEDYKCNICNKYTVYRNFSIEKFTMSGERTCNIYTCRCCDSELTVIDDSTEKDSTEIGETIYFKL